jgi:quinol-cytochrome oxidoreductase complex cytochrome b subunit
MIMETFTRDGLRNLLKSPKGVALLTGVAVLGYVALRETVGLETMLSFLLFGGCMLMHLFMHGSHGHGNSHTTENHSDDETPTNQR